MENKFSFSDIRRKYPQYDNVSDDKLADGLHRKFAPEMDRDEFYKSIGFPGSDIPISEVAERAYESFVPSLKRAGREIIAPFEDPVGTAKNLYRLGEGAYQKFTPGVQPNEKLVDAVGKMYADRYGGWENIKRTAATDPVGGLLDLGLVFTGAAVLPARIPGAVGKVGKFGQKVGRALDPLSIAAKAVSYPTKKVVGPLLAEVLGLTTGAQGGAIRGAAGAGLRGGKEAKAFREHLRGGKLGLDSSRLMPKLRWNKSSVAKIVTDAERALEVLYKRKNQEYLSKMRQLGQNRRVIGFDKIDDAVGRVVNSSSVRFKAERFPEYEGIISKITERIDHWRGLNPAEYHTASGLDALKRQIGLIQKNLPPDDIGRQLVGDVYDSIKKSIDAADPMYAGIMKSYSEAAELTRELRSTFSMKKTATVDTTLRKLLSIMRDNASTNYSRRSDLARELEKAGATQLRAKLSGEQLRSLMPRGLARLSAPLMTAGAAVMEPLSAMGALAASSPRLVGEAAYKAGQVARPLKATVPIARGLLQTGRLEEEGIFAPSGSPPQSRRLAPPTPVVRHLGPGPFPNLPESPSAAARRKLREAYEERQMQRAQMR